jgi:serine/threonine-protein phosphatase 2A regulatory subunit B
MDDLKEVITTSQCHPNACHQFLYSTSGGSVHMCDMRERALCDSSMSVLAETGAPGGNGTRRGLGALSDADRFFGDIICSASDATYSHCGR